jgi:23S rRNA (uracil1939-C5)-methyltransferase
MTTSYPDALIPDSLDLEGQGVARRDDGKVVFIEGALPGEPVSVKVLRHKNNWEQAEAMHIWRSSPMRVKPRCPHFGLHAGACGGCKMQHLAADAQVAVKQRVLEDNLQHLSKVVPQRILRPIQGPTWGYRYRARLSVRYVAKKGEVLVGFHERKSRYVADMRSCAVMPRRVSDLLMPLRALVASMAQRDRLPQIEVAMGDEVLALVLRHLEPLVADDLARLRDFAQTHAIQWWLQPGGPQTVHLLDGEEPTLATGDRRELAYDLPAFGVHMPFKPTDFTQVNPQINDVMVSRALHLLGAQPDERLIDWFCGLGNFTLPMAHSGAQVLGIEGSEILVQRAQENAIANGLQNRATFRSRNLFEMTAPELVALGAVDRWLVDPPREGAFALSKALTDAVQDPSIAPGWTPPERIVYVSCNPATLARDAGLLVHQAGYTCTSAGVMNMFPHTAHVESMAVFDRLS